MKFLRSIEFPTARYGLDGILVGTSLVLLTWGLIMVASASVAQADKMTGAPFHFFYRQLFFVGLGLLAGSVIYLVPMKQWENSRMWLLLFAVFLLILVLIPGLGLKINHARRWIDLGVFRLQASEPARLALILYLASYITRRQAELQNSFRGLINPIGLLMIPALLLLLEPDFGATVVLFMVAFLMLFLGGARLRYFGGVVAIAVGAAVLLVLIEPYRMRRILNFTNPWADIEHGGWQLAQSLIAVGRGEWTGVGLGNSVQKLLYLPEMHTDFIFAILAEEFGLVGIALLMTLFGVIVWRGFVIGRRAEELDARFRAYLTYGLSSWIGFQALINMAVNMGILPTKGLTLPLISYGGSSLVSVCLILALILRVDYENRVAAGLQAAPRKRADRVSRPSRVSPLAEPEAAEMFP
ncbi:putative lipid II flippase FtsW [Stenotrophobium rhamnosiphilum]|uniref:Probable peptidoglycan glycosyltransferase FtsW n=1 Tax=Stenotrophobium rhamnosiphilum TaxID=2029166 RepID=A0A2T5MDP2_9GAMM|nr:putative lipid II flippase FtsW [Stenotrophobium rhamnosiphilum]PTU30693.1 putative lipid II flippase FtsW [Stenotrophobium rhamnosiphilum]